MRRDARGDAAYHAPSADTRSSNSLRSDSRDGALGLGHTVALGADAETALRAWPRCVGTPCASIGAFPLLAADIAIAVGHDHVAVIKAGKLLTWGGSEEGQLGYSASFVSTVGSYYGDDEVSGSCLQRV